MRDFPLRSIGPFLLACCLLGIAQILPAQQVPHIHLNRTYGGIRNDEGYAIAQTGDSGFAVAGYTGDTTEPGLPDYHGGFEDAWILKLDNEGNVTRSKCLGGSLQEECNSMVQTRDGGYCLAIRTESSDGDVVDPDSSWIDGGSDGWIVKLTGDFQIQWQRVIGGSNWDDVYSIVQTDDGGYAVAGYTRSNDGTVVGHHGGALQDDDAWITKLDSNGNIQWTNCYGGLDQDWAQSIVQTPDHGYCFCGFTSSDDGDVSGYLGGDKDLWIVKLDSLGKILWQHCLGGDSTDWGTCVSNTTDSGFIVTGLTYSNDDDVSGNHGGCDAWVVKLNAAGQIQWQRCLGGDTVDKGWFVRQVSDGGYVMAGLTQSDDGDVSGNHSAAGDAWIVKLDPSGTILWQHCYGGSDLDVAFFVSQLSNGDLAFIGQTESSDGDIPLNRGNQDMWFVTLTNNLAEVENPEPLQTGISIYPQPASSQITIQCPLPISTSNIRIEIRNILGMTIFQRDEVGETSALQTAIDISHFTPGCYFVTISGPEFSSSAPLEILPR